MRLAISPRDALYTYAVLRAVDPPHRVAETHRNRQTTCDDNNGSVWSQCALGRSFRCQFINSIWSIKAQCVSSLNSRLIPLPRHVSHSKQRGRQATRAEFTRSHAVSRLPRREQTRPTLIEAIPCHITHRFCGRPLFSSLCSGFRKRPKMGYLAYACIGNRFSGGAGTHPLEPV
jgi:hypothetical protein